MVTEVKKSESERIQSVLARSGGVVLAGAQNQPWRGA
jgi:hypothetical protein